MKFQVGDRVAIYDSTRTRTIGNVVGSSSAGDVMVEPEGFTCAIPFAPQQLRKLVKRERRRVWIDPEYLQGLLAGGYHRHATASPNEKPDWIEFIEVRRRK